MDIASRQSPFENVDWSRTTAYSMGLGKIFLNRRGREPQGIVDSPAQAEQILSRIVQRLEQLQDPEDGRPVVRKVYRNQDIFSGPPPNAAL